MIYTDDINFVSQARRRLEQTHSLDRRLFLAAAGIAVVSVLMTAGMGAYWQWQERQLQELETQLRNQERLVSLSSEEEARYMLYTRRLDLIGEVIGNRSSKEEALDFLSQLLIPNIAFDRISFDPDARLLSFRIRALNVISVENFLETVRQPTMRDQIEEIQVSAIRRDEQGAYLMELNVVLQAEATQEADEDDEAETRGRS